MKRKHHTNTKKAVHIYAVNGKTNSGDFFLGPSTKYEFESLVPENIEWTNFDVRKRLSHEDIKFINLFDYVVIGGGGLFLPDTNPNMISCWQWACHSSLIKKITSNIYVIGIGWNHFYGQRITMPNRNNDEEFPERYDIFKNNVETLIDKSKLFTMRHTGDTRELKKIVDLRFHDKIEFSFCPVIKYVGDYYKNSFCPGEYIAFEIKDDRPNRRYYKKGRHIFYKTLLNFINFLLKNGEKIAVMSHDGSNTFALFLRQNKIPFHFIDNTIADEKKIIQNYSRVKKLYCTAGHSQMTAYALGLNSYSLIGHEKLSYFLEDINKNTLEHGCPIETISLDILKRTY